MARTRLLTFLLSILIGIGTVKGQIPISGTGGGSSSGSGSSTTAYDNSVVSAAVDASGNPSFLTTAAGVVLPINGGTTPLVMYIAGVQQTLNTNVTLTVPSTVSVPQWILAVQDTINGNMVAGDFLAMNTAPFWGYVAPTCPSPSPALSATNPAYWFDLSTGLSKTCTANGGAYSANPSLPIGMIYVDTVPKVLAVAPEPFRLSPFRRLEFFGNGSDGSLTVTSGTTSIDTLKQYTYVLVSGGTLTHTSNNVSYGLTFLSQNPVMEVGGTISALGKGRGSISGAIGAGSGGSVAGIGGAGGGGGGSGVTASAGGSGGGRQNPVAFASIASGGTGGTTAPTAGGIGAAANTPMPKLVDNPTDCAGASGGSGGGDGTNLGGASGPGGGVILIKAPAIFVLTALTITSDGNVGLVGAGGNAAGGGGGGGGCVALNAGYFSISGATVTANGAAGGSGVGTGQAGGLGGNGITQQNRLF